MPEPAVTPVEAPETVPDDGQVQTDPETFPRSYVEDLRREAAEHRVKAKRADDLAARLLAATVAQATAGILADPTDLPAGDYLDDDGYPDPERIADTARALVTVKPHLADRRPVGDVDQGARPEVAGVNLAGIIRGLAG